MITTILELIFRNIGQVLVGLLLMRVLPPSVYGSYAVFLSTTVIMSVFIEQGVSRQFLKLAIDQHRGGFFAMHIGLGFLLGLCGFGGAALLLSGSGERWQISSAVWLIIFIQALIYYFQAELQRSARFRQIGLVGIAAAIAQYATSFTVAFTPHSNMALIAGMLVAALVNLCGLGALAAHAITLPRIPEMRDRAGVLHFGLSALLGTLDSRMQSFAISSMLGLHALGIFDRAQALQSAIPTAAMQFNVRIALPSLVRMKDNPSVRNEFFRVTVSSIYFTVLPISVFVLLSMPILVDLYIGHRWDESVEIMKILLISAVLLPHNAILLLALSTLMEPSRYLRVEFIRRAISAGAILVCAHFGIVWVAVGASVIALISIVYSSIYLRRYSGLSLLLQARGAAEPVLVCLVSIVLCHYIASSFDTGSLAEDLLRPAAFMASYLSGIFLLQFFTHWRPFAPVRRFFTLAQGR